MTKIRAQDVPDVDKKGSAENVSDPYLVFRVLDGSGQLVDEARTA